jgi:hypothetical protein
MQNQIINQSATLIYLFQINCQNLRITRQKENDNIMCQILTTKNDELVKNYGNTHELYRVLEDLNLTLDQLLYRCSIDNLFAKLLAGRISKKASRQGTKDEFFILDKCNEALNQIGIKLENLSTVAYRPTKDGRILSKKQYNNSNLKKNDCLKSFDAKLSGKENGWIFAKVAYGKGGHQDNVFAEAHEFGTWAQTHGKENELYIILIDTDLTFEFIELKTTFNGQNIMVCDHFELQFYFLRKYAFGRYYYIKSL